MDNLYLPIFIITQSMAIIIAMYPIKNGLKEFFKICDRKTRIVFEIMLLSTFLMFVPVFLIDQKVILGTLWQSSIVDRIQYDFAMQVYVGYSFVALPLSQFYNFHYIRTRLKKEKLETNDSLRNNLKSIFFAIVACIGFVVLAFFVNNFFT